MRTSFPLVSFLVSSKYTMNIVETSLNAPACLQKRILEM